MLTRAEFESRYDPEVYESLKRMFFMVSRRISQQGLNERQLSSERFDPHRNSVDFQTDPNQEVSL